MRWHAGSPSGSSLATPSQVPGITELLATSSTSSSTTTAGWRPAFRELSPEQCQDRIAELIVEIQQEGEIAREGNQVAGRAAVLAAEETPSPEMVAAAPEKGILKPRVRARLLCRPCGPAVGPEAACRADPARRPGAIAEVAQVLADRAATLASKLSDTVGMTGDRVYRRGGWRGRRGSLRHLRQSPRRQVPGMFK